MNPHPTNSKSALHQAPRPIVTLSPWVNERFPPWDQLLNAHQVARLTRRSRWVCVGLALLGRFPKQRRFRDKDVGWLRADIVEWLAQGGEKAQCRPESAARRCVRRRSRQACLPLECRGPCVAHRPARTR